MMGTTHWIEFYQRFAPFCAMARQYNFFKEEVDRMEQSFWAMCPLPQTYKQNIKKKVNNNVSGSKK